MYKILLKPLFFLKSPESAHYLAMRLLTWASQFSLLRRLIKNKYSFHHSKLERELFGLKFKNPVGLAAGFDKDARWVESLELLGFGFIEIGTLTPKGQPGNPQPRLFRLPEDSGLINRMGFNNEGIESAIKRLKASSPSIIIGGNIGKNKTTPNENAVDDYLFCFNELFEYVDYFVVNVSSPNTPGLRELQEKGPLLNILLELQKLNVRKPKKKPILLKIAPDLTDSQLDDIIAIVLESKIDGVVATNTTIDRTGLKTKGEILETIGAGGLSGLPVKDRSTQVIKYLNTHSQGAFPIIGVGGIFNAKDAKEKLEAGASLIQIYTGFIYEGPSIASEINKGLIG